MISRRSLMLVGLLLLVCAGLAMTWYRRPVPVTPQNTPAGPTVAAPAAPVAQPINRPTAALPGYATWPVTKQRQALADLERAPVIDPETTRFLLAIVKDRQEAANARNLAANALTAPGRWVGGLADILLAQAADPTEDAFWRDYALQHAATVAIRGVDVATVVSALHRTVAAGGPSSGTALLMLQRIGQDGRPAVLDPAVLAAAVTRIGQSDADVNLVISTLGVIGERQDRQYVVTVRRLATSAVPAVRRAACGALGRIGADDDIAVLTAATADADASVAAAAAIASDRIAQRRVQP